MKRNLFISCLFVGLFVSTGRATYTYEVYIYGDNKTLHSTESILVDIQGGMNGLTLEDQSSAYIFGTSSLNEGTGGIWYLSLSNNSHLNMSGGQINQLTMNNSASAILTGGYIQQIWSYQWIPYTSGRDGVPVPNIKLYYSGDLPTYNTTTDILTGLWGDGTNFSIYLHDVAGYDPVIENIEFILIPEPATMLLFGLGCLLLPRRKQKQIFKCVRFNSTNALFALS